MLEQTLRRFTVNENQPHIIYSTRNPVDGFIWKTGIKLIKEEVVLGLRKEKTVHQGGIFRCGSWDHSSKQMMG